MIDRMLAEARSRIVRYSPAEAAAAGDVLLVDLRSADERERTGVIPGSKHVASSLAAASLVELGVDAGDLDGGFEAWAAAGLPVE